MKKIFSLLLILTTMLTLGACSDNNDEPKSNTSSELVGTWVYEKSTNNNKLDITISVESVFVFNANNTFQWDINSKMDGKIINTTGIQGTYSYKPNTLTLCYDGQSDEVECVIHGNSMTLLTSGGESMTHHKKN